MTYVALGEVKPWWGVWSSTDEVYLLRFRAKGLAGAGWLDFMSLVRAAGEAGTVQARFDVRGVAVSLDVGGPMATIDVVLTLAAGGLGVIVPTASGMLASISADPSVRAALPGATFSDPQLLQLVGPADAVDHWRAQPILWDHDLSGPHGKGGPTDTFARPADYSLVWGSAEDGKRVKPWTSGPLFSPADPPTPPGTQPGTQPPAGPPSGGSDVWAWALLVALGGGLAFVSWRELRRR